MNRPMAPQAAPLAPADEAELAGLVAECAARGTRLRIEGGGSRTGLGRPVTADAVLSTRRLDAVSLYEPAALTLVAGAGARVADITAMLAAEGQRLPFEPMDHAALYGVAAGPTLGGMVAVNASGPRRIAAGACRDSLIGVRFVDGAGRTLKNGGRVMKNVTGYDLVKLMAGSHGTLGVLTEVAFKLLPLPETSATLAIAGLSDEAAVAALAAALGSPYDVTGAACVDGRALVRLEGFSASVAYRAERLAVHLAGHGTVEAIRDEAEAADLWAALRDVRCVASREGAVWRLSLPPSHGPLAVAALREAGLVEDAWYDWGGGLVWLLTAGEGDAGAAAIRREARRLGGHAMLVRAPDAIRAAVPVFHPEPAPIAALSAGIRAKFDPAGILNPGRMTG